jgi:hypothetical protein
MNNELCISSHARALTTCSAFIVPAVIADKGEKAAERPHAGG